MIRNEREILNVVTSKAPKVASRPAGGLGVEAPNGVRGGVPEKKIVSKMKTNITRQLITRCHLPRTF